MNLHWRVFQRFKLFVFAKQWSENENKFTTSLCYCFWILYKKCFLREFESIRVRATPFFENKSFSIEYIRCHENIETYP